MKLKLLISGVMLLFSLGVYAQTQVRGKVTDSGGEPLPGASIVIKGTGEGTVTDIDGNFNLTVNDGSSTLVFSYVGFETQEISVQNRSFIEVTMQDDITALEEVVVVGYGTQRKRDVTGSISSIDGSEISEKPVPNALNALQGKAAGLLVTNSGRAGSSPTVRIRGIGSINGVQPLYIVDGIFVDNINFVNPADIESVEVLKDASSLAVFGVQGANGAIIITTKRAKKGQTTINFNSYVGLQTVTDRIGLTNAEQFKTLYNEQLANIGASPFDFSQYEGNDTDWQELILRNGMINNNSLSIRSGTENNTVNFTVSYLNQEGVQKYENYERLTARLRDELTVTDNIRVGADINFYSWSRNPTEISIATSLRAAPVITPMDEDGNWNPTPSFQRAQVTNPVAFMEIFNGTAINNGTRFVASAWAEIDILKDLTWKSIVYSDWSFNNSRSYSPLFEIGTGNNVAQFNNQTSVRQSMSRSTSLQMDHTLTYNKSFGSHKITALGGIVTRELYSESVGGARFRESPIDIPNNPDFWYLNIGEANTNQTNFGGADEQVFLSMLGRVNYSYANRYLLNATFRRDGSSKFSPSNRWGNFGSVGAGWVISDEAFFPSSSGMVEFLKLKASWGTLGNDQIGNYRYFPVLDQSGGAVFGDNILQAVQPTYLADPNLQWEVVTGIDIGIESSMMQDRLDFEFGYYNRETSKLLVTTDVPVTNELGVTNYLTNLGSIVNSGIEITTSWSDQLSSGITYKLSGNFTTIQNEVTSIGDGIEFAIIAGNSRTVVGQPVGSFFGLVQEGIFQTAEEIAASPQAGQAQPGDIRYKDVDGDGVFDEDSDRTFIGNPLPDFIFGGSANFGFKGFDLQIDVQGVAGNEIYRERSRSRFAVLNYEEERLGRWVGPGTSNTEPIMDDTRPLNYEHSTYFIDQGDYFRIRNISLGYNLPQSILETLKMTSAKVYVNAQNPITWHRARNYSPEISGGSPIRSGVDNGVYPVPAVYTMGVNLNF